MNGLATCFGSLHGRIVTRVSAELISPRNSLPCSLTCALGIVGAGLPPSLGGRFFFGVLNCGAKSCYGFPLRPFISRACHESIPTIA